MDRLDGSGQVVLEKILKVLDQNLKGMGLQNEATGKFAGLTAFYKMDGSRRGFSSNQKLGQNRGPAGL